MTKRPRAYINIVRLLGATILISMLTSSDFRELPTFAAYLGAAVLLSILKVQLPGLTSSVSLNTIPMLIGVAELSPIEAVSIGCLGTLVQSFWHAKRRPKWLQLSFNLAVMVIATNSSGIVYRAIRDVPQAGASAAFAALSLTFYTMDTLPVCTAIALTERKRLVDIWRDIYASSFHLFMMGATVAGIYTISVGSKWMVCIGVLPLYYLVYRAYYMLLARLQQERNRASESASLNLRTIEALVAVIQARDGTSDEDDRLVQTYSVEIAKQLQLPENEMKALAAAAMLRDIGKMAIPDHLLSKPGQLTPAEMDRVKKHVTIGADILARVNFPFPVVPIVRAHHEKWDGTGYPDGLAEEKIPLGARILSTVDSLISMTSERSYRRALSIEEAMGVVISEAGRSYDPAVVAALESRTDDLHTALQQIHERRGRTLARIVSSEVSAESTDETSDSPLESITLARREDQVLAGTEALLNLRESLSVFAIRLSQVVHFDTIVVYSQVGERLVPEYVSGEDFKVLGSGDIRAGEGVTGKVAETGKANLNGDPADDFKILQPGYKTKLRAMISVPIESAMGRRGVLNLYSSQRNAFKMEDLRVLLSVRLKVLDWELNTLASSTLLMNLNTAVHDESAATSFSKASK